MSEAETEARELVKQASVALLSLQTPVEIYDNEVARGLVHRPDYSKKMEDMRREIPAIQKALEDAHAAMMKTLEPYDPDNHTSYCGCVVQDGRRIHWCGDHY